MGVDVKAGQLLDNPHPFGQLPCLTDDDDVVVFESGAILQYLHEHYDDRTLTPAQAAAITSWIVWANASLDPICFLETTEGRVYDTGLKQPNKRIDRLNELLSKQEFLVPGAGFTLADVAVASYFLYVLQFFPDTDLRPRWPHIVRYLQQCASRPAYAKAFGSQVQKALVHAL
jgi:glutathione S-transferase/alpha,alpha-trehalase